MERTVIDLGIGTYFNPKIYHTTSILKSLHSVHWIEINERKECHLDLLTISRPVTITSSLPYVLHVFTLNWIPIFFSNHFLRAPQFVMPPHSTITSRFSISF